MDKFMENLLRDEDMTEDEYLEAFRRHRAEQKRLVEEKRQKEIEKKATDERFFKRLLELDAAAEACDAELKENDRLRAEACKEYDLAEMKIRQKWADVRREFDQYFRHFNNGEPLSDYSLTAGSLKKRLKLAGAKVDAVAWNILGQPMSPTAKKLWEQMYGETPREAANKNIELEALKIAQIKID